MTRPLPSSDSGDAHAAPHAIDNTRRLARIANRWQSYPRILLHAVPHVPLSTLARTQFPFVLPDAPVPPILTVELTNYCNLRCGYCTSPLALRPRGFMTESTIARLEAQIAEAGITRVRLVGNGEPTLHPRFAEYVRRLAAATRFLSMVTNGRSLPDAVIDAILEAPVRLVEFSAQGTTKEAYESTRVGGDYDRFRESLLRLKARRDERGAATLINIRVMVCPSDRDREGEIVEHWKPFADTVMRQYVLQRRELPPDPDAYLSRQHARDEYPRCTLPFKDLGVLWTGEVPLCMRSQEQVGEPGLLLGNVNTATIRELWTSSTMKQYRQAHRGRDTARMPICAGCVGV